MRSGTPPFGPTPQLMVEAAANAENGCVGHHIVLENARLRVWSTCLQPGERLAYHQHRLDHLWVAQTACRLWSIGPDGKADLLSLSEGDVSFQRVPHQQSVLRSLLNDGSETACFLVVELIDSANPPLPVPEHVRRRQP